MPDREMVVLMNGERLGTLTQTRHGQVRLTYLEAYRQDPDATPLSTLMPLAAATYIGKPLLAFLQGLLPDSRDVLDRWASRFKVSADNPFALLSHVGEDVAGAVQFVRPERLTELDPGGMRWLSDEDIRARIEMLRVDPTSWFGAETEGQFSLAGAQAKFALAFEDGSWGEPHGTRPTTHIVKPSTGRFKDQHLNEHLCLRAAAYAGLTVARSELMHFGDESAVAVERYDRIRLDDGTWLRIHQEDCCQALGILPDRKYQSDGGPGTATVLRLLRTLLPGPEGEDAAMSFVEALAFNWLAGGTDAHAKNFSLLLAATQVRLAPLYDLTSALPYRVRQGEKAEPGMITKNLRLAMRIGSENELGLIRLDDWKTLADEAGVDPEAVVARITDLAERLPTAFLTAAQDPNVATLDSPVSARLVEDVAANVAMCRSALAGRPARTRAGRARVAGR